VIALNLRSQRACRAWLQRPASLLILLMLASSPNRRDRAQNGRQPVRARAFRLATAWVASRSMAGDETGGSLRGKGAQAAEVWQKYRVAGFGYSHWILCEVLHGDACEGHRAVKETV